MAYLILSNLILMMTPILLLLASRSSKYPKKLDFGFSILTLGMIILGFIPEHIDSMSINDFLLVVVVYLFFEILEKFDSLDNFSGASGTGKIYYILALLLISLHAFFDGMGFHLEHALTDHSHHGSDGHLHDHSYYSLSLGLLLHRFPIGVLLYQKFFAVKVNRLKGIFLLLSMMVMTCLGYAYYELFAQRFGAQTFAHTFEYFVVALLLHFVITNIYNTLENKR